MQRDRCSGENKDCVIKVRVNETTKNKIHSMAIRSEKSDSAIIRDAIEQAVARKI